MSVETIFNFMELIGYLILIGTLPHIVNLCIDLVFHPNTEMDLNVLKYPMKLHFYLGLTCVTSLRVYTYVK